MRLEHINPVVKAALGVLRTEMNTEVKRGKVSVVNGDVDGHDLTILIAVTGAMEGLMAYALDAPVACGMASAMMGEEFTELDEIVQSGVAEIGNVISGRAMMSLADLGMETHIAPPVLLLGHDTRISTLNIPRLLVPIELEFGTIMMYIALKPTRAALVNAYAVA
ncbi:MAG: chemotaxis protein CheX [Thermomicrobiales bacterium]